METATTATTARNLSGSLLAKSREMTLKHNWYERERGQIYLFKITHLKGRNKTVNDVFYKIGYTNMPDLQSRINYLPQCFNVEIIDCIIMDKLKAFYTEQLIHKHFRQFKHKPKHCKWSGADECYTLCLLDSYPSLNSLITALPELMRASNKQTAQSL